MIEEKILQGEKVILRSLTAEDVPLLARWLFSPEVLPWLQLSEDPPHLRTVEAVRERYERMRADWGTRLWRIDTQEGFPVGQIELVNIHPLHGRAEIHLCIGETGERSRGMGTAAIRCLLHYVFQATTPTLRRVFITPDADNGRAIRCFEKSGFVREGVLRAHRLRHGQPTDMVMMGVLREDFLKQ